MFPAAIVGALRKALGIIGAMTTVPNEAPAVPAPLTIARTRGGALRWSAIALGLLLLVGWLVLHVRGMPAKAEGVGTLRLLAAVALLAGIACAVRGYGLQSDRSPGLVLDARGLTDGVSGARAGLVPWSEIQGLAVLLVRHRYMLVLKVADPQRLIAAATGWRRPLAEADLRLCGSPLALPDGALAMDFDALVKAVHAHRAAYLESRGIAA